MILLNQLLHISLPSSGTKTKQINITRPRRTHKTRNTIWKISLVAPRSSELVAGRPNPHASSKNRIVSAIPSHSSNQEPAYFSRCTWTRQRPDIMIHQMKMCIIPASRRRPYQKASCWGRQLCGERGDDGRWDRKAVWIKTISL